MESRITIVGEKKVRKMIADAAKRAPQRLETILAKAAFNTQNIAITSIQTSPATGRTYRRRTVKHTASAPGQPPRTDRGFLVANITVQKEGALVYTVGSRKDAPHGFWLEFGTSKMAARPWLSPAARQAFKILEADIRKL